MLIKIQPLLDLNSELKKMQGQLIEESYQLTYVYQALQELSSMEDVINNLHKLQNKLESQSFYMKHSSKTIESIAENYISCENKILDKYEHTILNYDHTEPSVVELNQILNILGL